MGTTVNNKIQRGFSRSARDYDRFSGLHREIADQLLAQIRKGPRPSTLVDVGCGTGYLTVKVKEHFSQCHVVGLDFSQEMLEVARAKRPDIAWILADGDHLPFSDAGFDRVISNLAYQWAGDLNHAMTEARRVLAPGGILACTLFGHNTCRELFQSLDEAKLEKFQFTRLPDQHRVHEALVKGGFKGPLIDEQQVKIEFKDMHELIVWLKSIGANNLPREGYVGKEVMARAAAIYRERFSSHLGIQATFEVIQVYAEK